jgi:hypothetical protein
VPRRYLSVKYPAPGKGLNLPASWQNILCASFTKENAKPYPLEEHEDARAVELRQRARIEPNAKCIMLIAVCVGPDEDMR